MIETKFKQTEIGLIPDDWEVRSIGSLCKVHGRIGFRGYTTNDLVKRGEGAIAIAGKNITHNYLDLSSPDYISWYKFYESPEIMVRKGDIVIAQRGTLGRSALIDREIGPATINPSLALLNNIICNNEYLYYYLVSQPVVNLIISQTGLTSIPMISQRQIEQIAVALPKDKQEQSRIAEALSDIDKLIASLSKMIEKKWLMKQGTMQQLLTGKKRLPGFDGEWVGKKLKEVCNVKRGVRVTRESLSLAGKYPVFQNTNYPLGFYNKYNVEANTPFIIVGGSAGLIGYSKTKYWAADDCAYFSNCDNLHKAFLYYALMSKQCELKRFVKTASVPRLDRKIIEDLDLFLPPTYSEQSAIANVLTTMDNEIESLEEERDKYIRVKEGMMQKLLTGQIRLVETEAKVVAMPKAKGANVHFKRSVLAAEIANRLCEEPTFGHVKMEKLIFLTEHLCHIDTGSHYHRDAAGPYDNTALRSIDKQMKQHQWFVLTKKDKGYRYQPMDKRGDHKKYFDSRVFNLMCPDSVSFSSRFSFS